MRIQDPSLCLFLSRLVAVHAHRETDCVNEREREIEIEIGREGDAMTKEQDFEESEIYRHNCIRTHARTHTTYLRLWDMGSRPGRTSP